MAWGYCEEEDDLAQVGKDIFCHWNLGIVDIELGVDMYFWVRRSLGESLVWNMNCCS
jgi:hypothetical protein